MNCQKQMYESPLMKRSFVELEDVFCVASKPAVISKDSQIVVEDYETIDNQITFD